MVTPFYDSPQEGTKVPISPQPRQCLSLSISGVGGGGGLFLCLFDSSHPHGPEPVCHHAFDLRFPND